jgi:copper chaperone NosL
VQKGGIVSPRRALLRACLVGVALSHAACAESSDAPVDPIWGKEPCAHCAMLVSERAHAAELVTSDGTRAYFDDVGCMIDYLEEHGHGARALWVHEADGRGWLDARAARYARGARTPMSYGFSAAPRGAEGVDFATVEREVIARSRQVGDSGHER